MLKLLFVLFVGLKLGEVIDWSWWAVCIPAFIEAARFMVASLFKAGLKEKQPWALALGKWLWS
ncbi:MAG: hypothetical protein DRR06_13845 [Gammaproteobacteria bacterium]|nr:MAG: hypothetical protein DRR06_13845 [Gammaproteobacteria bacterium]